MAAEGTGQNNDVSKSGRGKIKTRDEGAKVPFYNDPVIRSIVAQFLLIAFLVGGFYWITSNYLTNSSRAGNEIGFNFLGDAAGVDISDTMIEYHGGSTGDPSASECRYGETPGVDGCFQSASTNLRAFFVGVLNTIKVSIIGIIFATIIGFAVGIMRLSKNWLLAKVSSVYIEIVRNIPLVIQILFWYFFIITILGTEGLVRIKDEATGRFISATEQSTVTFPGTMHINPLPNSTMILFLLLAVLFVGVGIVLYRRITSEENKTFAKIGIIGSIFLAYKIIGWTTGAPPINWQPVDLGNFIYLNAKGMYFPDFTLADTSVLFKGDSVLSVDYLKYFFTRYSQNIWFFGSVILALIIIFSIKRWARKRQDRTGRAFPTFYIGLAILIILPAIIVLVKGIYPELDYPEFNRFSLSGGYRQHPEMLALVFALSVYTASYIAEIVRSGILAVSHGQTEASHALGLRNGQTLRLVVIPQAMRVIIPPLTSQFLNLTKNSSLAVVVGYNDVVKIFAGTILEKVGRSFEVMSMVLAVYLTLSIATSILMNWYNSRMALTER